MGETSSDSRKRRRNSSASRSRSRSRTHKSSSARDKPRHRRSRSQSRSRVRKHSRSSRRSASRSTSSRSRSRSRSRSPSRRDKEKEKERKHAKRSRRSSSAARKEHRKKSSSHKSKKSSRDKRRRDKDRDRSASRSRSRRKDKEDEKETKREEPLATAVASASVAKEMTPSKQPTAPTAKATPPVVSISEKPHRSARRSRSPTRKYHRSRSRSRSRGRNATVEKATKNEASKSKPLTFTGISLKTTKGRPNGVVAPVAGVPVAQNGAPVETSTADDEKQRRRDKLKLWRDQQLQAKQQDDDKQKQLVSSFLAADDPVPKRIKLWSLDEAGDEKKESPEETRKREQEQAAQRQREQKVVEEVDPLDAYMAGLVDEAAIQQSIANPAANVISLDEIQSQEKLNIYGTFLPPAETLDARRSESVKAVDGTQQMQPHETDQAREAREQRELQEFMRALREKRAQEEKEAQATKADGVEGVDGNAVTKKDETGRIYQGLDEDILREDDAANVDHRSALEILQEAQKKKDIQPVDHSKVEYIPFQKKFYVVPNEIKSLSEDDVQAIQDELEIKIRGKNCPRPLDKWTQCGFSVRMLQLIQKQGYAEPFAIQRQALPAIMSGRDVIGIAKTGSGKTLAFLLPMFRHILHQPPLKEGEGPIGLIMAPARELAQQIYVEAKRFAKGLGMRATAVYGGSSVSEQIGNLKRGSDIVICTPGRMIDILCMNAGKMVSLKRVTYVVLDEADRMFDMGFEPQITKIMLNIRPDRQTLLFSATFPKAVETLARKVLKKPVEITVGARSTASGDIVQYVEVRDEKDKFMRLLQLLGLWYEKGNILVFVNTQQACDQLFQDLMKAGYPGLSLHGGKDQVDRDFTIDDFKRKVRTLMVATSVAGRGLDVKDLVLVINYHCPNHLEDYVHRVGRTGRAGRKGTAYTFISPDEEEYSVDLVKALESGKQVVPPELTELAENFKERVRKGEARYHGSGFKGKGFTFDDSEKNESQRTADMQKRQYELQEGIAVENQDASDDDEAESVEDGVATGPTATASAPSTQPHAEPVDSDALSAIRKAQQIAQILDRQYKQSQSGTGGADEEHFDEELEINDYPQQARWKVTQKEATERVAELTGAAVITRGSFVQAGRKPNAGERKLYLAIEGPSRVAVLEAKRELQRILDETTLQVGLGGDRYGKYNV